jgi:hypothetical protein
MRSSEDALRSLKRYVAEALGGSWEVRLADEEGVFSRPFAMVWESGPAPETSRGVLSEVAAPFTVHAYPATADAFGVPFGAEQAKGQALAALVLLRAAFLVGVGVGRPFRVPLWDYSAVSWGAPATARGASAVGTGGGSVHGDYMRVDDFSLNKVRDDVAEGLWTVVCQMRLGWRRPGRLPSGTVTVERVDVGPADG